ncbi:MAG: DNA primase [Candidatus Marsarchaeota archaeon]|nr:DNA primase [Candidatus Marsarchaeota archaeon]
MGIERPDNVKEYYHLITEIDIGLVAKELLGGRIVQESAQLLQCDCPNHKSLSRRSLQIILDKQSWFCFGCGVGGDVLQVVEFVQSGHVTAGKTGPMPESHRRARDFLAEKAGLPPLCSYGLSPEKLAEAEAARSMELRTQSALTAVARYYNERLKSSPKVLEWFIRKYGISLETIDSLLIGYADNLPYTDSKGNKHPEIVTALTTGDDAFTLRELAATGAFNPTSNDTLNPGFNNRIIFPYGSHGRVVFMIGRQTPWTANTDWEQNKYKKLKCHDEHSRQYIAPCISNSILYNEDCLANRPDRVIITEGVTDCISLMERGFPVISPVTIQIKDDDWRRILPKLAGVKTVYICQDNEISEAGMKGALRTARHLASAGIETKLVVLPLGEKHATARSTLREQFGLDAAIGPSELKKRLAGRSQVELKQAEELLGQAKIDVNEFFVDGHTTQDFEALLSDAITPLEYSIERLPKDVSDSERNRLLEPILQEIAEQGPLEQARQLKRIQDRYGKNSLSLSTLKEQIRALQKDKQSRLRAERRQEKRVSDAPSGSCRACVEQVLIDTEAETGSPDHTKAAEAAYEWFASNGARFFRTRQGDPFMFFEDRMLWMDASDKGRKRLYSAMIYNHTGLVQTMNSGRTFTDVLANLAAERGEIKEQFTWLHTDIPNYALYFNLNNENHEIAKITPDGIEIMKNGGNADGIILDTSDKMEAIHFTPDADEGEADRLLAELILNNLTCSPAHRFLILAWLSCFLLIDFAGTRPMTRFEGSSSSGKTMASKLITALLYGAAQQKKSTDAANYSDGSKNPLIALDNIEVRDLTEELVNFMLTSITGIAKEKRKAGTDTDTIVERTKCLLNTTGIEPLAADLSEILSRTFTVRFELGEAGNKCFLEAKILAQIRHHRDLLLSVMMKRTSHVLALLRDGAQERVMELLHTELGNHNKRRCNDYLSLMYLMLVAGKDKASVEKALQVVHPQFVQVIAALNMATNDAAKESNPIATSLSALFRAYRNAVRADQEAYGMPSGRSNRSLFAERYQIEFADERTIKGALGRELFVALKRIAKEYNLSFEMKSVQQFAQRLTNDLKTVREAGFAVDDHDGAHHIRTYDITCLYL